MKNLIALKNKGYIPDTFSSIIIDVFLINVLFIFVVMLVNITFNTNIYRATLYSLIIWVSVKYFFERKEKTPSSHEIFWKIFYDLIVIGLLILIAYMIIKYLSIDVVKMNLHFLPPILGVWSIATSLIIEKLIKTEH